MDEQNPELENTDAPRRGLTRRGFLGGTGAVGAGVAGAMLLGWNGDAKANVVQLTGDDCTSSRRRSSRPRSVCTSRATRTGRARPRWTTCGRAPLPQPMTSLRSPTGRSVPDTRCARAASCTTGRRSRSQTRSRAQAPSSSSTPPAGSSPWSICQARRWPSRLAPGRRWRPCSASWKATEPGLPRCRPSARSR